MTISYKQRLLTRQEVAARLGVSSQTVARWAKNGLLPFVLTLGGQRRYPEAQIEKLAQRLWRHAVPGRQRPRHADQ